MKCPICTETDLVMTERQGVEIDYCPECRGIWLDRGELEKILERSYVDQGYLRSPAEAHHDHGPFGDDRHDDHDRHQGKHYRRKSWLAELFD